MKNSAPQCNKAPAQARDPDPAQAPQNPTTSKACQWRCAPPHAPRRVIRYKSPMRRIPVRSDPMHLLWHYANGRMPDFVNKTDGPVGWVRWTHRGVQPLDEITFPESQKRYIFSKKFELRFNTAFEEVIRECADPNRFGKTWITPELVDGLIRLNKMGFAYSFE